MGMTWGPTSPRGSFLSESLTEHRPLLLQPPNSFWLATPSLLFIPGSGRGGQEGGCRESKWGEEEEEQPRRAASGFAAKGHWGAPSSHLHPHPYFKSKKKA